MKVKLLSQIGDGKTKDVELTAGSTLGDLCAASRLSGGVFRINGEVPSDGKGTQLFHGDWVTMTPTDMEGGRLS